MLLSAAMRLLGLGPGLGVGLVMLVACGGDAAPLPVPHPPVEHPLVAEPYTTLQALWAPRFPSPEIQAQIDAGELLVTELDRFEAVGLGVELAPGLPWLEQGELAPSFPGEGEDRRSVAYFWEVADPQIIDEESPIRLEGFDVLYRPHGHLTVQSFESHVRSAQRLSDLSGRPFDFALVAGDITDGSQANELRWALETLHGGPVHPDSGHDDDPLPGPGNDYNDPLLSRGIEAPWYAVIGNHETLYNGGFAALTEEIREAAAGSAIYDFPLFPNGFRDGATPNADVVVDGTTTPDAERLPLYRDEVIARLGDAPGEPPGHGLGGTPGYFSALPIAGVPLRLIGLDTVNSSPTSIGVGSLGWMDAEQLAWLEGELAEADAQGEIVVVLSHHRSADFYSDSPVTGDMLKAVLEASAGVILHVTGHGHGNDKQVVPAQPSSDSEGYWELMVAATVDFPMQSRIIEIVDEQNGYLSIYVTNLGHNAPDDSLAHRARVLAAAKRAFPSFSGETLEESWPHDLEAQNLLLRIPISDAVAASLAAHDLPTRIESLATLSTLPGP